MAACGPELAVDDEMDPNPRRAVRRHSESTSTSTFEKRNEQQKAAVKALVMEALWNDPSILELYPWLMLKPNRRCRSMFSIAEALVERCNAVCIDHETSEGVPMRQVWMPNVVANSLVDLRRILSSISASNCAMLDITYF